MKRLVILVALAACAHTPAPENRAPQGVFESCRVGLRAFFGYGTLDDAAKAIVHQTAATWRYAPHDLLKNASDNEVMYVFDRLPQAMKDVYLKAPHGKGAIFRYFEAIADEIADGRGLLQNLQRHFQNKAFWLRDSDEEFADWLVKAYSDFHHLGAAERSEIVSSVRRRQLIDGANDFVNRSYYAVAEVVDHDGKKAIKIGNDFYEDFRIKPDSVQVRVPRERMAIGADNPLEPAKMQSLMANGGSGKSVYDVNLGLNGVFYIVDGNHRFALYEKRDWVWVRMGSLKSMNIREFRLRVGLSDIDTADKIRAMRGQIAPIELLPPDSRQIFVDPAQLRQAEVLPLLDP